MRKEYGKVLRESFTALMKQQLPQFKPIKYPAHPHIWPGDRIFRWIPREPIHCFIILVPTQKGYDTFTIEIGWSTLGRYPPLEMRPVDDPTPERKEFGKPEFVCRLPWLIPDLADWWSVTGKDWAEGFTLDEILTSLKPLPLEEARQTVLPVLTKAMQYLLSHGVPYLEEFVKSRS
jgi:hypothetical protein